MAYDHDNIFAKILRGEADAHAVLDDAHCLAFMDRMPQSPGHTLVVPREPAANLFELDADALSRLIVRTQRVARAVSAAFEPTGVMIAQLNGADAGQTVFHIHFHIIPRYPGQSMQRHGGIAVSDAQLAEHAERIRAALDRLD